MENIKFSIMIPVYNVEKYLHECLNSVIMQSYKNKEIILVDDGSTDSSGSICDEYSQKYDFITVIHQENMGQYMTRKKALKHATGDYCLYMDSDDFWDYDLLTKVKSVIDETACDVVIFDRRDIYENEIREVKLNFENGFVFEKEKKQILYDLFVEGEQLNSLVFKAFKKELLSSENENEVFSGKGLGEDAFESASLIINAEKVVYLSECLYNYRRNVGVTSKIGIHFFEKNIYYHEKILDLFEKNKINVSKNKMMLAFMQKSVLHIIAGYRAYPEQLKEDLNNVTDKEFYKEARKISASGLTLLEKMILNDAEKKNIILYTCYH